MGVYYFKDDEVDTVDIYIKHVWVVMERIVFSLVI